MRLPCFYGIDMPTRAELVASDLLADEVASYLGADSLGYLSLEALTETAAGPGQGGLCTACFTGNYPIPVGAAIRERAPLESLPWRWRT
jgi:amidophosphoribosyltransferase